MRYSIFNVARQALRGHQDWTPAWRDLTPRQSYDVIIIGGGGHGLATAYYLAKLHGIRNIAVLEKGWLGGGNTGRNTTIVRSNYLLETNAHFYEHALKLWEGLSQDLNYNVMFSQRGVLNLAHSKAQMDAYARRGNAMRLNGIDAELLDRDEVRRFVPELDFSDNARFPVFGGLLQPRGGTARHDAVAWGLARGAEVGDVRLIDLPGLEPRGAIVADLRCGDQPIRVIGAHLGLLKSSRWQQSRRLADEIDPERPTLMMGDMNEWRRGPGCSLMPLKHGLDAVSRAGAVASFPARRPMLPLDRIIGSNLAELSDLAPHDTPLSRLASDHLPLRARLRLGA